ncbi:pentapeptide repeat-containing protein [Frankia sp. Mgl5]|uniref:pentapeptide repeat-containing protein n=1 Tax=Frankia sp. Mgl5 TaxID=2933793 RepID=UPI00200DB676|nr:pentapeptide repeat-containing protein [Frankia sp. Mgl5]MCK9925724.1 pentapeptide repeat-containing protein [Frankia sp. Mgl5]
MAESGGARRRSSRRWLWVVAGIAAVGAVAAVVGIWHLPDRMYPPGTDGGAEAQAALQAGLLTAAAALTAVAGGLIVLDETRQTNRDTHVRELYVDAVKLLNDTERGIRLAGIYTLERIAVDSPADQRVVVEVLSAFVRDRSTDPALRLASPLGEDGTVPPVRPMADIRTVVQVLGRLPVRVGVRRSDLTDADLTGPASLAHLTLHNANLIGALLDGANFTEARLGGATLTGALLDGANLTRARLHGANLTEAGLRGANLTGAQLEGATLTDAWLRGANLTDAVGLSQEQVEAAHGDDATCLPAGLVRPASWTSDVPSGS